MRHRKTTPQLGREPSHRKAMLRNMVTDFFRHERITTTRQKAKALQRLAERLITKGKQDTLHARRIVARTVRDKAVIKKLFDEIAPRYAERPGGYTRIIKLAERSGDNAKMAIIELVEAEMTSKPKRKRKSTVVTAAQETKAALESEDKDDVEAAEAESAETESAEDQPEAEAAGDDASSDPDASDEDAEEARDEDAAADAEPEKGDADADDDEKSK